MRGRDRHIVTPGSAQLLHLDPGCSAGRRLDLGQAHQSRHAGRRRHHRRTSAFQAQEHPRPRLADRLSVRAAHGAADGGADLLAVHQRHPDVDDDIQLQHRRDGAGGPQELSAALHQLRLPAVAVQHDQLHLLVAQHQVRHRHDDRHDPPLQVAVAQPDVGDHAAALDRARDRHGVGLEIDLRPAVRWPQPHPAGRRPYQQAAGLAVGFEPGTGQRHRGERLEGHPVLHAAAASGPQGDRYRTL